jgi:hypothetical protein
MYLESANLFKTNFDQLSGVSITTQMELTPLLVDKVRNPFLTCLGPEEVVMWKKLRITKISGLCPFNVNWAEFFLFSTNILWKEQTHRQISSCANFQ